MAVTRMKKAYLVAHQSLKEELIEVLQEEGLLHIENLKENLAETELASLASEFTPQLDNLELLLSEIQFVLDIIEEFKETKKGIVEGLLKKRIAINRLDFDTVEDRIDFRSVYQRCEELDIKFRQLEHRFVNLNTLITNLQPWQSFKIPLSQINETDYMVFAIGKLPYANLLSLQDEWEREFPVSIFELISKDAQSAYLFLIFLKEQKEEVNQVLQKHGYVPVNFGELNGIPQQEIMELKKEVVHIQKEKEKVIEKIREIGSLEPELLTLHDFVENKFKKAAVVKNFVHTDQTFMLEAWVQADREVELSKQLSELSSEVELTALDPEPDEEPPVILKNSNIVQPFEVLTRLYGLPDYREMDPTPLMAPFFFLFFGLCIGDFGYGVVLALISWLATKKLQLGEGGRKFFYLLAYGGISSMIVGIFTGGYFGIEAEKLPAFLQALIILNPLKEAFTFLIVTVALGVIHVCFGIIVEFIDRTRQGAFKDALYDQGTTLFLLIFLIAYAVARISIFGWLALASAAAVVLFHGRGSKSIIGRLGLGLYKLYGMSSFIGDFLSYARLMALGLATVLIGWVVNMMGSKLLGVPFLGPLLMIVILLGGHFINLVINLLSAFVHPLRLQYVEFFKQFYSDGGGKFVPFMIETKHLIIKREGEQ